MLDDPFLDQEIGDVADAQARRNVDDLVGLRAAPGHQSGSWRPRRRCRRRTATRINTVNTALPAMTSGWRALFDHRGRHWNPLRLQRGARAARRRFAGFVRPRPTSLGVRPASPRAPGSREVERADGGPHAAAGLPGLCRVAARAWQTPRLHSSVSAIHPTRWKSGEIQHHPGINPHRQTTVTCESLLACHHFGDCGANLAPSVSFCAPTRVNRQSAETPATRWCRRIRTSSTAPRRSCVPARCAARGRSRSRPTDCRD